MADDKHFVGLGIDEDRQPELTEQLAMEAEQHAVLQPMLAFLRSERRGCSVLRTTSRA